MSLLRQIEFYFSDANYPRDEFLQGHAQEDGSIPITIFSDFPKVKSLGGSPEKIAAALESSDTLQLNADKDAVSRKYPVPTDDPEAAKTVFVKGFEPGTGEAVIEEMFKACGTIVSIRLLRNILLENRPLDGSAFIAYSSEEEASAAVEMPREDYVAKPMLVWFEEMQKKRAGQKRRVDKGESTASTSAEPNSKRSKKESSMPTDYPKGTVVSVSALGEGVDRENLKELCTTAGKVEWIEYERSKERAFVRFSDSDTATAATSLLTNQDLSGHKVVVEVLEGDDEFAFWKRKHDHAQSRPRGGRSAQARKRNRK